MAFSYYKTFTTDASQCGSAETTDYPIIISVTDADLKTVGNGGYVQNASGYDIRPFSDVGLSSALTFELIKYVPTSGYLQMAVKVSTLSHTTNLVSYLAFGDSGISTDGSSTSTWNSNFKAVFHFDNQSIGTDGPGNTPDSTSNANTLSVPAEAGWRGGELFAGIFPVTSNISYALFNTTTTGRVSNNGDWTIEAWVKYPTFGTATTNGVISQWTGGVGYMLLIQGSVAGAVYFYGDLNFAVFTSVIPDDASWHHVLGTKSGSTATLYVDGTSVASGSMGSANFTAGGAHLDVSAYGDEAVGGLNGIDEARLSDVARSASYAAAVYNNTKASSTFLTWGSLTPVGGGPTVKQLMYLGVG